MTNMTRPTDGRGEGLMPTASKAMDPATFASRCRDIVATTSGHEAHRALDLLTNEVLSSLGYGEGIRIFEAAVAGWHVAGLPYPTTPRSAGALDWFWWAGRDEEEYCLAGPCRSRKQAIDEAYGDTEPGDIIYLVEAVVADEEERDPDSGIIPFVRMRKRSHVIRKKDAPL